MLFDMATGVVSIVTILSIMLANLKENCLSVLMKLLLNLVDMGKFLFYFMTNLPIVLANMDRCVTFVFG